MGRSDRGFDWIIRLGSGSVIWSVAIMASIFVQAEELLGLDGDRVFGGVGLDIFADLFDGGIISAG